MASTMLLDMNMVNANLRSIETGNIIIVIYSARMIDSTTFGVRVLDEAETIALESAKLHKAELLSLVEI